MNRTDRKIAQTDKPILLGYVEGAKVMQVNCVNVQIDEINDIIYSQVVTPWGVRQLHMSMLVPRSTAPKPAIVFFPGGGFFSADHGKAVEMRIALARAGFVVAAAEYRVLPACFPAPVIDGKSAIRYLRQHAKEYGIDSTRIGVIGNSVGGWLAQMLGTTGTIEYFEKGDFLQQSSSVQAVASLYGLSDLATVAEGLSEKTQEAYRLPTSSGFLFINGITFNNANKQQSNQQKVLIAAAPIHYVSGSEPPFLLMHGSSDTMVSPLQSAKMYQKLKLSGVAVEYLLLQGAEHADQHWSQSEVVNKIVDWFKQTL